MLYAVAAARFTHADRQGDEGAGIGIIAPFKGINLNADAVSLNATINALRAPAERANALLKATWPVLRRVTLDPWRIIEITAAALVLLHLERPVTE
ncbi:hypothetical protein [Promicromonospora sp. NPDC050880]|uniref:hypothetical protein n=1 Tax=Promicromonospora sp. NPDC050880 TaxID=3364406 RepID=UPI0037B2F78E